jgi:hypothetical protein
MAVSATNLVVHWLGLADHHVPWEEPMKIARIITVALAMAFSAGVALAPWTPISAEDPGSGSSKSKKKTKTAQKNKNDKGTVSGSQTSGGNSGWGKGESKY